MTIFLDQAFYSDRLTLQAHCKLKDKFPFQSHAEGLNKPTKRPLSHFWFCFQSFVSFYLIWFWTMFQPLILSGRLTYLGLDSRFPWNSSQSYFWERHSVQRITDNARDTFFEWLGSKLLPGSSWQRKIEIRDTSFITVFTLHFRSIYHGNPEH